MAKSSYCYQVISINTDKYVNLRVKIKEIFDKSSSRYGYRRIYSVLKSTETMVSEKVVRQIMKEENLLGPNIKRKRYSS
jgi:transposase InsO family protein